MVEQQNYGQQYPQQGGQQQPAQPAQPRPAQPQPAQQQQPVQPRPQPVQPQPRPQQYQQYQQYRQPVQQYPQQYRQPVQQQYTQPQQQAQPQKLPGHHYALIIAAIIVVIFVGAGAFLMMPGEEMEFETTDYQVTAPAGREPVLETPASVQPKPRAALPPITGRFVEFGVRQFVFADMIYEDYSYDKNPTKIFSVLKPIYIFIEPQGIQTMPEESYYRVDIEEDLEVRDSDGNIIDYLTIPNIVHATRTTSGSVAIRNYIYFEPDAEPGMYEVKITLRDKLSGKTTTKTDRFVLVKG